MARENFGDTRPSSRTFKVFPRRQSGVLSPATSLVV
ncbi:hypothetical protein M7I_7378 [Glarea lozoyensis 74030]|uniref:Uncharacterized protein n=1 Tax=Glarea lozoyensis (strain ATCC 74030 / MF5533) TaxID=1104152 RepID=H0EX53_GLAL7|nr:hypothetical protein M7I_7378 [Glarea lozoyensis 74030]